MPCGVARGKPGTGDGDAWRGQGSAMVVVIARERKTRRREIRKQQEQNKGLLIQVINLICNFKLKSHIKMKKESSGPG